MCAIKWIAEFTSKLTSYAFDNVIESFEFVFSRVISVNSTRNIVIAITIMSRRLRKTVYCEFLKQKAENLGKSRSAAADEEENKTESLSARDGINSSRRNAFGAKKFYEKTYFRGRKIAKICSRVFY